MFEHSVVDPDGGGRFAIDIDGDGHNDIVTSQSWENPPIMLWRNQLIP